MPPQKILDPFRKEGYIERNQVQYGGVAYYVWSKFPCFYSADPR